MPGIWYVLALAGPAAITLAGSFAARVIDHSLPPFSVTASMLAAVAQIFVMYLFLNTEEVAWRGYVLPWLQAKLSPIVANLVLGVIWAVFHCPLFLMKGGHPSGFSFGVFVVMVVATTSIAGAVFNATGGSILIAHLLHQSLNAWGEGLRVFPTMNGGSPWPFGITAAILIAAGLVAARFMVRTRRTMAVTSA